MHFHLPKPLHGWREFVGEVGVIVLGIVIALAAEQWVEAREWRHKAEEARDRVRIELAEDDGPQGKLRVAIDPCVQRALDHIRELVETRANRADVLRAVNEFRAPYFSWDSLAYQSAVASGVTAHLPSSELNAWAMAYAPMDALNAKNRLEFADQAGLLEISRVGGNLSGDEQRQLLRTVEVLRRDNRAIVLDVGVLLEGIKRLGLEQSWGAPERRLVPNARRWYPACADRL